MVVSTYEHGETRKSYSKTVVTGKGLTYLAKRLKVAEVEQRMLVADDGIAFNQ